MPKRIQRRRSDGWTTPPGAVYVGRPSKWGNPFKVGDIWDQSFVWHLPSWSEEITIDGETKLNNALAVEMFAEYLSGKDWDPSELKGLDLVCWCRSNQTCHADVLLEWANKEEINEED